MRLCREWDSGIIGIQSGTLMVLDGGVVGGGGDKEVAFPELSTAAEAFAADPQQQEALQQSWNRSS